jgi:hypothetical protein
MIGAIQQSLRYIFSAVLDPEQWGLDIPLPEQGSGLLEPGKRWRRSLVEIPVLKNRMMKGVDPRQIEVEYIFQYRAQFRFSGGLKYADLPTRKLYDILEYVNYLITTHPGLLSMSPARIAEHLGWAYPHVDPCLYLDGGVMTDPQSNLSIQVVSVNGFVPVIEMDSGDWLITLVWSIEAKVAGDSIDFRRYFRSVLTGDPQITPRDLLLGGDYDRLPYQIRVGLYRDMPE